MNNYRGNLTTNSGKLLYQCRVPSLAMDDCDRCGDAVSLLLRRRAYGRSTTHRTTRWLCRECHPEFATDDGPTSDGGASRPEETVVTDGGTNLAACPQCSASAVNVQGILECLDCRWTGR